MADLRSAVEITKLAAELGVPDEELAFLCPTDWQDIRALRTSISTALFLRHEAKFRRVAGLSRSLPGPITAKIAQLAIGPVLSARVAAVMDPDDAVRLVGRLSAEFLTDVSACLNPVQVAPIISALPHRLVVDVGHRLLARGELITLAGFISVVAPREALQVVAEASGAELLQIALYAEDRDALDEVIGQLPAGARRDVLEAAADQQLHDDLIMMLSTISPESQRLFAEVLVALEPARRDPLVAVIDAAGPELADARELLAVALRG